MITTAMNLQTAMNERDQCLPHNVLHCIRFENLVQNILAFNFGAIFQKEEEHLFIRFLKENNYFNIAAFFDVYLR